MEKSDFCGHQFGVQKPQQKPVSPQRASPVQEHVRTYMLAGRGEQLVVALQNHGNPAVCKTCRVPAETIETCTIFCPAAKILPTKRPPFWGPFLDPKTGAKSPGHKQIKLRLNEWTPFWGPFLDPKTGVVLSAKLWSPSEKKHKFRLFLHVRDRSFPYRWVSRALQRREYLFSTPCEHLCPHMFLNCSRACADIHACRAWRTIGRGAAKSWKPSGMQNLSCTRGNNRNLHYFLPGGKNFADKTTPVLGSVFGPQNGGQVARTQANQIETE